MTIEAIWELAATHAGHTGEIVRDYTTPTSPVQQIFSRVYPGALEMALGLHDWGFARKRVILTDVTATHAPSSEWQYTWTLPTDLVAIRGWTVDRPNVGGPLVKYETALSVDGTIEVIYTRCDPFPSVDEYMLYTYRAEDPTKWTPLFEKVLAAMLASEAAVPLGRGSELQQKMLSYAQTQILMVEEVSHKDENLEPYRSSIQMARY